MQETDRIMEEMYAVLEQHQTVGWLELVMNHKDFSQTVENIFTLSFLVSAHSRRNAGVSRKISHDVFVDKPDGSPPSTAPQQ